MAHPFDRNNPHHCTSCSRTERVLSRHRRPQPFARLRYRLAWVRWWLQSPIELGSPWYGRGDLRTQNLDILLDRYYAAKPRPEQFGLPPREGR